MIDSVNIVGKLFHLHVIYSQRARPTLGFLVTISCHFFVLASQRCAYWINDVEIVETHFHNRLINSTMIKGPDVVHELQKGTNV